MDCSPIALFAFNRPDHLRRTIDALCQNPEAARSELYVFCDGPRSDADRGLIEEVRNIAEGIAGFQKVSVVRRDRNLGLAASIIAGVTDVCSRYGRVVVVEDDILCSPHFLAFMNSALDFYASDGRVGSIHGYWYPVLEEMPESFFLRGASCWGWATWQRSWMEFRSDGAELLDELLARKLTKAFDLGGAVPYTRMLREQIAGKNQSWAIRWHASMFLAGRLQLSPGKSLVDNIGFDGSGTHRSPGDAYRSQPSQNPVEVRRIPVEESEHARAALISYYRRSRRSLPTRLVARIRRLLHG
jgi:hypothetical protein